VITGVTGHALRPTVQPTSSPRTVTREPSQAARDDATARRLWQLSEEMTGLGTPGRDMKTPAPKHMTHIRRGKIVRPVRIRRVDPHGGVSLA